MTDQGLPAFRQRLLQDEAAQARLAGLADATVFTTTAGELAREWGLALDPAMVDAAVRPDPLGLSRFQPPALYGGAWPPAGWLPARVAMGLGGPEFDWARFGPGGLDDPFYEDAVRRVTALPFNRMMRWRHSLADLIAAAPEAGDPPAGFIFHLSRCGSTLLARLLTAFPGHAKLSEPEPLDAVVQWASRLPPAADGSPHPDAVMALRAIVRALTHNLPRGTRAFFKTDCWHIAALPLFRAAFPDVPWLFLYRDPLEVAVSQQSLPGVQVVPGTPGAALLGLAGGEDMAPADYIALVLGRICAEALGHAGAGRGMLLHYDAIFPAMADMVPRHFGFSPDPAALARIEALRGDNAKHPGRNFTADSAGKRAGASAALIAAIERDAWPFYEKLETMRQNQSFGACP